MSNNKRQFCSIFRRIFKLTRKIFLVVWPFRRTPRSKKVNAYSGTLWNSGALCRGNSMLQTIRRFTVTKASRFKRRLDTIAMNGTSNAGRPTSKLKQTCWRYWYKSTLATVANCTVRFCFSVMFLLIYMLPYHWLFDVAFSRAKVNMGFLTCATVIVRTVRYKKTTDIVLENQNDKSLVC